MSARTLDDLITDGGIRSTYFFNGRLLSGEDLRQEQDANRSSRRELGQAIGAGIAYGFEVTQQATNTNSAILTIAPGLAINPLGQAIQLNVRVDLSLLPPQTQTSQGVAAFSDCLRPANGVYVVTSGVYLLAVCPVGVKQGRAPTSGLGNESSPCNSNSVVDGLQFLLVPIPAGFLPALDTLTRRNAIAWQCFGVGLWSYSPFGDQPAVTGLVDTLRVTGLLHDCDVPLAIFSWLDTSQIQDLDAWPVRRRTTRVWPDSTMKSILGDVRQSNSEASVLQFESHLSDLLAAGQASNQSFRYLPPAGYLPAGVSGFDFEAFLKSAWDGVVTPVSQGILASIFRNALFDDPIDLQDPPPVRVYKHASADNFVLYARTRDARLIVTYAAGIPATAIATLKPRNGAANATLVSAGPGFPLSADVPPGSYELEVSAANFSSYESGELILVGGEIARVDNISLSGAATGSLQISFKPRFPFRIPPSVKVTASHGAAMPVVKSGNFTIASNLPPDSYSVEVSGTVFIGAGVPAFTSKALRPSVTVSAGPPTIVDFQPNDFSIPF